MKAETILDIISLETQSIVVSSLNKAIEDNYALAVTSRIAGFSEYCLECRVYFHHFDSEALMRNKFMESLLGYGLPVKDLGVSKVKFLSVDKNMDIGRKDITILFSFKISELNQKLSLSMNKELFK